MAGGRELHLRSLQPLGLYAANSLFIGDYLTTEGQAPSLDLDMVRDLGFEIEGQPMDFPSSPSLSDRVSLTSRKIRLEK
jgi:biotin synthase-like enzyme